MRCIPARSVFSTPGSCSQATAVPTRKKVLGLGKRLNAPAHCNRSCVHAPTLSLLPGLARFHGWEEGAGWRLAGRRAEWRQRTFFSAILSLFAFVRLNVCFPFPFTRP